MQKYSKLYHKRLVGPDQGMFCHGWSFIIIIILPIKP
jgi:hypothetical protein